MSYLVGKEEGKKRNGLGWDSPWSLPYSVLLICYLVCPPKIMDVGAIETRRERSAWRRQMVVS
jgi:hypothetical protein